MKKQLQALAALALLSCPAIATAQTLTEKTGLRFYEHHSSDMTNNTFGTGANGAQSGYDFVNQKFYNSFNEATFGAYVNGEETNIDMVEHNGPFGSSISMLLGFTSGTSTIWGGSIKGNGTTKWMKAPSSFNYAMATDVTHISQAYNDATAIVAVARVNQGDVYIGRIRGGNQYVAIRCTATRVPATSSGRDNCYFDFDYKTGSLATGLNELSEEQFDIYPTLATDKLYFRTDSKTQIATLKVFDVTGKEMAVNSNANMSETDISALANGIYFIYMTTPAGETATRKFIKN